MPFVVNCQCGKALRVRDEFVGRKARCPACGAIVPLLLSLKEDEDGEYLLMPPENPPAPSPATVSGLPPRIGSASVAERTESAQHGPTAPGSVRDFLYFALLMAFIPLGVELLTHEPETLKAKIERTLLHAEPAVAARLKQLMEAEATTLDDFLKAVPDNRLMNAHLPRDTAIHWLYAMIAALAFFAFIVALFPQTSVDPLKMMLTGLFTGTIGIVFLIIVQWLAEFTQGFHIRGGGKAAALLLIIQFIGFSYRAALDPENGFWLSFFGFTFGVGLCEEICKALPFLKHHKDEERPNWRGYCLLGLASGIGFGISEGIMYSGDHYNGVSPATIYIVRFVSCVALHAVWTASVGVALSKQETLGGEQDAGQIIGWFCKVFLAPMILHGLYDTLLKREMNAYALLTAFASFGYLVWQVETARKAEKAWLPSAWRAA